jgi:hypothetical protein
MLADGMEAILDAYVYLHKRGTEKPEWLEFCVKVADWLVAHQNEDGSYYILETMRDGKVVFDAKGNVISFSFWISEASYMDGELLHETVGDIVLEFSDYGTTVVE